MKKKTRMLIVPLLFAVGLFGGLSVLGSCASTGGSSSANNTSATTSSDVSNEEVLIRYNANGGVFDDNSTVKEEMVKKGSRLTAPIAPTRTGFSFSGWSQTKSSSDLWKFGTDVIESNVTLYAVWSEESAVILSVDGASVDSNTNEIFMVVNKDTDSVSLANKIVCSTNSTWKLYYDKLGQTEIPTKIAAGMSGILNNGENIFYIVVSSTEGDIVNVYTLKIHRSYAIYLTYSFQAVTLKTESVFSGYEISLDYTPEIKGYTFNHWMDIEDNKISEITPFESMSFYANATPNEYTVTLNPDGGSLPDSETTRTVTYDDNYTLPVPTRTGCSFAGWYNNNTPLTDSEGKSLSIWNIADDTELTAKWTINDYILSLVNSNSQAGTISGSDTYTYGENVTISATANEGYSFDGWYDSQGARVSNSSVYTFPMGLNETLTAKWNYVELTLHYVIDGEVVKTETYTLENHIEELYQYETDDYFYGWYDSKNFSSSDSQYTSTEGLTITKSNTYLYGTTLNTKFDFKYENDGYTITGYRDTKTEIEIPESINGLQVKKVGVNAFINCSSLTSITIPNSVTSIGDYAFSYCGSLTIYCEASSKPSGWDSFWNSSNLPVYWGITQEDIITQNGIQYLIIKGYAVVTGHTNELANDVVIPSTITVNGMSYNVTSIGDKAFYNCSSLTSIVIPNGVTSIGSNAFYNCSSLTIYCEASSKPSGWDSDWNSSDRPVYWGVTQEDIITQNGIQYLIIEGNAVVTEHTNENDVVIPSSIIVNGMSYNVTSIGDKAFYNCSSLTSIVIPNSVTSIGSSAFYNCSSLTSIVIPNSVTSIGSSAFRNCSSLGSITLPFVGETLNGTSNTHFGYIFGASSYGYNSNYVPTSLKEVIITGGTSIASNAFYNCSSLSSIVIPDSVTSIGSEAFRNCSSLTSVTIPNSVTSIGSYAFYNCSALKSITLPFVGATLNGTSNTHFGYIFGASSYDYNSKYVPTSLKEVIITGGTSIGDKAFYNCSSLTSIVIPNGVTSIGSSAFYNCSSLTSIVIPNSVTSIGSSAFRNCSSLTSVTIPYSVTSIGSWAFYYCSSLTSIVIPNSVTSIGSSAFYNCSSLTSIVIPNSVTSIGSSAFFECSSLTLVTFESGSKLTAIGSCAFYGCSSLTSIVIPDSVTSIGSGAFSGCSSLESITLPFIGETLNGTSNTHFGYIFGASSYDDNSKYVPTSLKEVIITGGTSIASNAFYNCSSLTSIVIPNSVTSIGSYAFYKCGSLQYNEYGNCYYLGNEENPYLVLVKAKDTSITSATISENTRFIMNSAFSGCSKLTSIVIPNSVESIGIYAFYNCSSLESITLPFVGETLNGTSNTHFGYIFGASSYDDNSKYVPTSLKEVIITGGASIGDSAFYGCSSLTSITIPNSVTTIGSGAFYYCSKLTSIVIPNSVTSIGKSAFYGCSLLQYNEYGNCYYLGNEENPYLVLVKAKDTSITTATISEDTKFIMDEAFSGSSKLTSIVIPNSVTSIGYRAFYNCSALTSIVIPNSVKEIRYHAFYNCSSLTIYCEASSKPSGWDSTWNSSNRPVYWSGQWSYINGVPTRND